jgi:hypothetical protein
MKTRRLSESADRRASFGASGHGSDMQVNPKGS